MLVKIAESYFKDRNAPAWRTDEWNTFMRNAFFYTTKKVDFCDPWLGRINIRFVNNNVLDEYKTKFVETNTEDVYLISDNDSLYFDSDHLIYLTFVDLWKEKRRLSK